MQMPGTFSTDVTAVEYVVHMSGEEGGDVPLVIGPSVAGAGIDEETLIELFEDFVKTVATEINANKPLGATVTIQRQYSGTANTSPADTVTY